MCYNELRKKSELMKQSKEFLDIVVDLETLGTKIDSIVTQVSAKPFHFTNDDDFAPFNSYIDVNTIDNPSVDFDTLRFWLSSQSNLDKFQKLLESKTHKTEFDMWNEFSHYLTELNKTYELRLWGNGIMFDIGKTRYNLNKFNLEYPIKFWNERDARTLVELASNKMGITSPDFQSLIPNTDKHNALSDVIWEINYLKLAYSKVM